MKRNKALPEAAAEITHTAADRAEEFVDAAMKKFVPLLEQAGEQIAPLALDAKKKGAAFASTQVDKAQPALEDALHRLVTELLPKMQDALRQAADLPVVGDDLAHFADLIPTSEKDLKKVKKQAGKAKAQAKKDAAAAALEARKRGKATVAALRGEIAVPERKNPAAKIVGTLAIATAVVGAAAVLMRQYLNQTDESGWAAHEPSTAYTAQDDEDPLADATSQAKGFAADFKDKAADLADRAQDVAHDAADHAKDGLDAAKDGLDDAKDQAQHLTAEAKDAADQVMDAVEESKDYGPGSYVGDTAPEGFGIKGNERSMKYHVEGNEGFDRTIADVWFESEEAAQAAGFIRAQR